MSGYVHAHTKLRETTQTVQQRLTRLRRLEEAIAAEEIAKEQHLSRLYAERRRQHRAGSYTPSAEALAYRDAYGEQIAAMPRPIHGGRAGLAAAAAEAEGHWAAKQRKD